MILNFLKGLDLKRIPKYKILLIFVVLYFVGFGIAMMHISGQPDQAPHVYFSNRFSETWGIPEEDPQSAYHLTGEPYLYYWINGAAIKICDSLSANGCLMTRRYLWRLISVFISTFTIIYLYKLTSQVTKNKYAGVLASFFLANTLMFVFLSSGVSYDNLMNLCSFAAIYHLIKIINKEDYLRNTFFLGIWLTFNTLTKEQALLLTLILFVIWFIFSVKNIKRIEFNFTKINILLLIITLVLVGLFLGLYAVNYIQYGHLTPGCAQVKSAEVCTRFAERREVIQPINTAWLWEQRNNLNNPFQYAFSFWILQIIRSIWGIISHNTFVPMLTTGLHGCLIIWGIICVVRYWRKEDTTSTVLIIIVISYLSYIFYLNYKTELRYEFRNIGIHGRYLFPVFGAFLTILINYFLKIRSNLIKRLTFTFAIILYFAGGLGVFLFRYSQIFIYWRIPFL